MSTGPANNSWGYAPATIAAVLLVIIVIWALNGNRLTLSGPSSRSTVEEAGEDLKAAGRDVSSAIRRTVD
jgi:hypothetical protein